MYLSVFVVFVLQILLNIAARHGADIPDSTVDNCSICTLTRTIQCQLLKVIAVSWS